MVEITNADGLSTRSSNYITEQLRCTRHALLNTSPTAVETVGTGAHSEGW